MNPKSGKKKKVNYQSLYDTLRKHGYDGEIIFTKEEKDAIRIVRELADDIDVVISCGGDGTLNEVITGDMQREKPLPLANLPLGTTNDVGNMYGLNKNLLENLNLLLDGVKKNIDVCYINDTPFIYVACLGDFVDVSYSTPRDLKEKYGKLGYLMYGAEKFFTHNLHSYNVRYKIDGIEYDDNFSFFFITNSSRVAGFNDIYYDIKLDDGKFEVALAKAKNKAELFRLFAMLGTRDIKDIPEVTYYRTDNIEIEFLDKPKTSWSIDGEEYKSDSNKFTIKVVKGPKMFLPKHNAKILFNN
jgi:YegS/Rv2252/BmrU family lipid kinase